MSLQAGAFLVHATVGEGAPLSSSSVSSLVETHPIIPASCVSKGKKERKGKPEMLVERMLVVTLRN